MMVFLLRDLLNVAWKLFFLNFLRGIFFNPVSMTSTQTQSFVIPKNIHPHVNERFANQHKGPLL
jgi:hypothetical protein